MTLTSRHGGGTNSCIRGASAVIQPASSARAGRMRMSGSPMDLAPLSNQAESTNHAIDVRVLSFAASWATMVSAPTRGPLAMIPRRTAACLSLLLLVSSAAAAQDRAMPPESERQLARDIYKEMVEIKSGYATGATTPVAEAAAKRLKAAGFPDADVFVGGASPQKANLVVRYHGSGKRRPILLLAHTDVVEAKREDWSMDPFTFVEKDGYFYARGTGDDKAQAAIWIANLIRYKREGYKPDRDIIVALTADEEGGGPYNGVNWLLKNKRELIDAELCLNEGGWGEALGDTKISNDIQVSEKYVINYRFEARNKGGHSSLPVADNAIYHLAGAL